MHAKHASSFSISMSNASILAAITETFGECKELITLIKGKENVQTAHYIVENNRIPSPEGLHLPVGVRVEGGGGQQRGGVFPFSEGFHLPFGVRVEGGGGQQRGGVVTSSILEIRAPTFEVATRSVVKSTADILAAFPVDLQITPVNDLFNDKLDFSVSNSFLTPQFHFNSQFYAASYLFI